MKKRWILAIALSALALACFLTACGNVPKLPTDEAGEYAVTLSEEALTLEVFERAQLEATVTEDGEEVTGKAVAWVSSEPTIATVANGLVIAIAEGTTTITATAEGESATCEVTVEYNGVKPSLSFSSSDEALDGIKVGAKATLTPQVRFSGATLDNAEYGITFSYSGYDNTKIEVSSTGEVTAKAFGTTTLTVTATVAGATGEFASGLTREINVSVVDDYSLTLALADGYSNTIYLQAHNDLLAKAQLEWTATLNGADVASSVGWVISDPSKAAVSLSGEVTLESAAAAGNTFDVRAKIEAPNATYQSDPITFTVARATVALDNERIDKDLSAAGLTITAAELGLESFTIAEVYDKADAEQASFWNEGIEAAAIPTSRLGDRTWVVVGEKISYELKVCAVTKVITTWEEFAAIFQAANTPSPIWNGYYVLGNNIDASTITTVERNYEVTEGKWLSGTLNGRGHVIDGLTIKRYGIFGFVGLTGKIQNLGLTNVTLTSDRAHVLAYAFYGSIDGLFVTVKEWSQTSSASSPNASGGLFYQCNDATSFKNVVVVNSTTEKPGTSGYAILGTANNKGAWVNTIVIAGDRMFASGDTAVEKYATGPYRRYESVDLYAADYNADPKGINPTLPTAFFDRESLMFKQAYDLFLAELNTISESSIAIDAGAPAIKLTDNSRVFSYEVTGLDDEQKNHIFVEGGVIKTLDTLPLEGGAVTFTVKVTLLNQGENPVEKTISITVTPVAVREINLGERIYSMNDTTGGIEIESAYFTDDEEDVEVSFIFSDEAERKTTGNITGGKLVISDANLVADATKLGTGAGIIQITYDAYTYKFSGYTFRYAIASSANLKAMEHHVVLVSNGYYGDFYMTADLDLTGYSHSAFFRGATDNTTGKAFQGIFDGKGRKISNPPQTGAADSALLFGTVGTDGVVRNLLVYNTKNSYLGTSAIICANLYGKLENIYVEGQITATALSDIGNNFANFGAALFVAKLRNASARMENCIGYLTNVEAPPMQPAAAMARLVFGATDAQLKNVFKNCVMIYGGGEAMAFCTYSSGTASNANNVRKNFTADNSTNSYNFTSLAELFADANAKLIAEAIGLEAPATEPIEE